MSVLLLILLRHCVSEMNLNLQTLPKPKGHLSRKAATAWFRLLKRLKRESELTSKSYLELLYEKGREHVTALNEINLDYLQFNYNFPAND